MGIAVSCSCGGRFQAPPSMAGQLAQCPACHQQITVPTPAPLDGLDGLADESLGQPALPSIVPRKRRSLAAKVRPWLYVLLPVAILSLLGGGVWMLIRAATNAWNQPTYQVAEQLAALQEAGKPTTVEEWNQLYALPASTQDSTVHWTQASLSAHRLTSARMSLPIVGESSDEPPPTRWGDVAKAQAVLDENEIGLLAAYEAVAERGFARYPVDFSGGIEELNLEHVEMLRSVPRMMCLAAHVHARQNDSAGAARDMEGAIYAINALRFEPVMITHVARAGMLAMTSIQLEALLNFADFEDQELEQMQIALRELEFRESFWRGMDGDRLHGILVHQDDSLGDSPLPRSDASLAYFLDKMEEITALEGQPWHEVLPAFKSIEATFMTEVSTVPQRLAHGFATLNLPLLETPAAAMARATAQARILDAGIATLRYRAAEGAVPASLAALVPTYLPAIPIDPFDGEPLRFSVKHRVLLIYSVGEDRKDEGGNGKIAGDNAWDIVLTLEQEQAEQDE